ncbi:leucine-rich repeat neuronal protein 3-like [Hylaeus volcanicus]|uniref:leucine-rich repeat neuronal protein 3-like n=1 Tax=Hylaeus volcanicus TaxID=313075 RepID=UPI0023B79880|nr:leucine-rich repeat neuronal protein 3-like [Hylaeus volcanicus]
MDRRLLFLVLFAFTMIKCEDNIENATDANSKKVILETKDDEAIDTNATESPESKSPRICQVCNCTKAGEILNCDDRNMTAIFTRWQWNAKVSKVASFKGNLIEHITPFPISTINRLILQGNKITKIDDAAFKQIINLTELDLSHNELTSESLNPKAFEGKFSLEAYEPLENLTILTVAYNKIHSFHQDLFEHMSNLRVLNMSHNLFAQIDYRTSLAISSIRQLEELDLSYCDLKQIPETLFHTTRYLKKLNLSGNRIMIPPVALGDAIALEYLYMDENPIKIINNSHPFPNMTKLKELSFCCMPHLTAIGSGSFLGLDSLETLRIQNCPNLQVIHESALNYQTESNEPMWPPLKELVLSDNALQYLPQYLLLRWDLLEKLDLTNNKWSCDCNNQYLAATYGCAGFAPHTPQWAKSG